MSTAALSASLPDPGRISQSYTTNLPVPTRGAPYTPEEQRSGQDRVDLTGSLPVVHKKGQGIETSSAVTLEILSDETSLPMEVLNQAAGNASHLARAASFSYSRTLEPYRPAARLIDTYV